MRGALLGAEEPLCFLACGLSIYINIKKRLATFVQCSWRLFLRGRQTDGRIDFQWVTVLEAQ